MPKGKRDLIGPCLLPGDTVIARNRGWKFEVVEHLQAIPGQRLECYVLRTKEAVGLQRRIITDVVARMYLAENYKIAGSRA